MRDIKYIIKSTLCKDGKKVWILYENNNIVQTFNSYRKALDYKDYYARAMR